MKAIKQVLFLTLAVIAASCGSDLNGRFSGTSTDPQFGVGLAGGSSLQIIDMDLKTDGDSFSGSWVMPNKGWSGTIRGFLDGDRIRQILMVTTSFNNGEGSGFLGGDCFSQFQGSGTIRNRHFEANLTPIGQFCQNNNINVSADRFNN